MQKAADSAGFITAVWCWMVSQSPNAQTWLIYLSVIVALLNIVWLTGKILEWFSKRGNRTG